MKQLPPAGDRDLDLAARAVPAAGPARLSYPDPLDHDRGQEPPGALLEYWRVFSRHKGTVALIAFLCGLAGVLYTLPQTPVFQSRLVLEIQAINEDFLNMRSVSPTSDSSGGYLEYDLQTQVRILEAESLVERVVKKLDIENRPLVADKGRIAAWRRALGLPQPAPQSVRQAAIDMASSNYRVRNQPNTRLIEILCDSTDAQLAADFANTLGQEFIEQNLEARWKTSQHTGEFLARQMEDLKIKLEKAEDQLTGYARSTNLIFTAEKENVSEQKLQQLQDELGRAQADRVTKQSRYELASTVSPETLSEILDDTSLRELQSRVTELRREAAELRATFTSSHPKVIKVLAQLDTLESARERERGNILSRIKNDFAAAQRREQLLATSYAAQARLVSEQAEQVAHYNILKREVETLRQLYDAMLQRVKEAGVAAALRASNIRVVDPARRPVSPYKPRLTRNAALGVLLGLFLGAGFVFVRERADRTLQEPGDPELYLNVSELGVIPSGDSAARRRLLPARRAADTDGDSLALVTLNRKPSVMAESFHLVLTSILFSAQNGARPHVLVLSSPNPREGKTTVVSNLAIALAEVNQRVLLVDADLRRPRVHDIFDLDNSQGLVDLLRRPEPLQDLDPAFLHPTSMPNLVILPAGSADTFSNLLHSPRLGEFVSLARKRFDMVLIDTPPMLQMADARVVSRYADAVVLVVRSRYTTRDAAQLARQRLAEDGTPVLGAILNDWNPRRTQSYGYYRYYDHYNKYYGNEKS